MSTTPSLPAAGTLEDAGLPLGSKTPVGVDVGRNNLLVLAPATDDPKVSEARVVEPVRLEEHYAALTRRQSHGCRDGVDGALADRLQAIVDGAAQAALSYVQTFAKPVVVLEDLDYPERSLGR
jgi:hypothetical protein